MPLATPLQRLTAQMLTRVENLLGYQSVVSRNLDGIVDDILAADDALLEAFANALGPVEMQSLCQAHLDLGTGSNFAITTLNSIAAQSGIAPVRAEVDIRPLADKLAAQGRTLDFDGTTFSVTEIERPPEPETEPIEEPQPDTAP